MGNWSEDDFPQDEVPQDRHRHGDESRHEEVQRKETHRMKSQDENSRGANPQDKILRNEKSEEQRAQGSNPLRHEQPEEDIRWDERLSREIARREQQIREIWQRRTQKLNASRSAVDRKGETNESAASQKAHSSDASREADVRRDSADDWTQRGERHSEERELEGHAWRQVLGDALHWQRESPKNANEHDETAHDLHAEEQGAEHEPAVRDADGGGRDTGRERVARNESMHESEANDQDPEHEDAREEWRSDASGATAPDYFTELKERLSFERGAPIGNSLKSGEGEKSGRGDQEHLSANSEEMHSDEAESRDTAARNEEVHREWKWRGILQNTLLQDEAADFAEGGGTTRGPRVPRVLIRIGGGRVFSRVAIVLLLLCSIALGAAAGLLFVYSSDLPQIQELENYRPDVVTEVYADDGSSIGTFALQRRILLTYEQIPKVLRDAIISTEDRHFMDHWGIDFPRVAEAAWTDVMHRRVIQGASTITMQLAGGLFLNRADRSFRRKIEEAMLAVQIERHYTKQQIFTMYCNQVYLWNGNYGVEAASEFYFGKPVGELTLPDAALLAGMIRGPIYSPTSYPKRALERRNLVLDLMADNGKISRQEANAAKQTGLGLNITYPQNNTIAPYYVEDIRQKLEAQFGTEAVHQEGLRVYSTLDARMQRDAVQAVRDGLHAYDRRHGWRGNLPNIFHEHLGTLTSYESPEWRNAIAAGDYVTGLIVAVDKRAAVAKIGPYRAVITPQDFAWTGTKDPEQLLQVGDLANLLIESIDGSAAKVELEQVPAAQAALVAIDNATGEIKAMVGGYNFQDSKFNRAVQAMRQTGSSFKVYVYATALEQGMSPFDTVLDEPVTYMVGTTAYSPHNYDNRFEGRISLRRALADSRNVPAVRILQHVGIENVIDNARKFGISSPLPPYLPLALGAADLTLLEHTSAFSTFPDDGIHIQSHMIRRVTSYDGAILEETRPKVTDVIPPDVARTMTAMLEDVVNFGTGVRAKALGRPSAGKTGTTNDFTDAWYIGFTPQITAGVWVGFDDPKSSLGKGETGARAALPIWLEFMEKATKGMPAESFPNVTPLEQLVKSANEQVDVPDTAPPADTNEQGIPDKRPAGKPIGNPQKQGPSVTPIKPLDGGKPAEKPGVASERATANTASAIPH